MAALDIGDVVQLRTGCQPMIVIEQGTQQLHQSGWFTTSHGVDDPDSFICIWWDNEIRYQDLFSIHQLEKI